MHHAVKEGRDSRPGIKLGICGEHGGDPASVEFCHTLGLNYVSCSPFRVPIARLAAARAAIRDMQVSGKPSKKDAKKSEKKAKSEKKDAKKIEKKGKKDKKSEKKKSDKKSDKKKKK